MSKRQPGEELSHFAIRSAIEVGSHWNPATPETHHLTLEEAVLLPMSDPLIHTIFRTYTTSDPHKFTGLTIKHHGRLPHHDGEFGPAMEEMVSDTDRCPVPDFAPPLGVSFHFDDPDMQKIVERMQAQQVMSATGNGNWKNCHGVVDGHCKVNRWDVRNRPAHLTEDMFIEVLRHAQIAYAQMGLLIRYVDSQMKDLLNGEDLTGHHVDSELSFVKSSPNWIGLATVVTGVRCGDPAQFQRFLATFKGGSTRQGIINSWFSLIIHEDMHNNGFGHTQGGHGNPSIIYGLPMTWIGDPSEQRFRQSFSGVPIAIPGGGPTPGPDPVPPTSIEQDIKELQMTNQIIIREVYKQNDVIDGLEQRLRKLELN